MKFYTITSKLAGNPAQPLTVYLQSSEPVNIFNGIGRIVIKRGGFIEWNKALKFNIYNEARILFNSLTVSRG